jgi:hypothetical protein
MDEEAIGGGNGTLPADREMRVNFSIVVPSQVQTRATPGLPDEGSVDRVYLLLFENIAGVSTYRHKISAENLSSVSNTQKTFNASLPVGVYDIAVLANASEIIGGSGIAFGDAKEQALNALAETNPGKWSGANIPMWGRIDNQTIDESTSFTGANSIPMIRMMAKVELSVTPEAAGANESNFKLADIRLYNYSSRGALVPDLTAWPADNKATRPSEPAGGYAPMRYPDKEPLVFDTQVFYTYEAPAGGKGAAMASNTCLIIGGSYRGGATTYYRIDFVDKSPSDAFLPLLRNHHYLVTVIDVVGDGYPTPQLAFETASSNMHTSVVGWNNGGLEDVVDNQPYALDVSQSEFFFTNDAQTALAQTNKLTIETSVPGGWVIEKIADQTGQATATWLTASETAHALNSPKEISLLATANKTGAERTAYVYVRAGELSYRVTVVQKELLDVWFTNIHGQRINEVVFPLYGSHHEAFNVNWTPASATVTVANTAAGSKDANGNPRPFPGTVLPANGSKLSNSLGIVTYDPVSSNYTGSDQMTHLATRLDFTISKGSEILTRTFFVRQYNTSVEFVIPSFFLLDGGEKAIGVRSHIAWEVVDVIDPDHIIANKSEVIGKEGGGNTSAEGENLTFRIAKRMNASNSSALSAIIVICDVQGKTYNAEIKAISTYEVDNLLVWPVDMPVGRNWYQLADVPSGTNKADIPPLGPRNSTVDPLSCAALDDSDKNLWRLPTKSEIEKIFVYFRNNGGYASYGMQDVDCTGGSGISYMTRGYWTAESLLANPYTMAYFAGYSTSSQKLASGAVPKTTEATYVVSNQSWEVHARCVRTK